VVTLTAFIPLLTGTVGNVGVQSSIVVIRGMNTDEMRSLGTLGPEAMSNVIGRNVRCDRYCLGLLSAKAIRSCDRCTSLVAISAFAFISGSALPFVFHYLRLDPAFDVTTVYDYRT
jgi:magnesium transporter